MPSEFFATQQKSQPLPPPRLRSTVTSRYPGLFRISNDWYHISFEYFDIAFVIHLCLVNIFYDLCVLFCAYVFFCVSLCNNSGVKLHMTLTGPVETDVSDYWLC